MSHIKREYDQEISQLYTADQPTALRAFEQSNATSYPIKTTAKLGRTQSIAQQSKLPLSRSNNNQRNNNNVNRTTTLGQKAAIATRELNCI